MYKNVLWKWIIEKFGRLTKSRLCWNVTVFTTYSIQSARFSVQSSELGPPSPQPQASVAPLLWDQGGDTLGGWSPILRKEQTIWYSTVCIQYTLRLTSFNAVLKLIGCGVLVKWLADKLLPELEKLMSNNTPADKLPWSFNAWTIQHILAPLPMAGCCRCARS